MPSIVRESAILSTDSEGVDTYFTDSDWQLDANCLGQDTEAFYPDKGGSTTAAKLICSQCVVIDQCLELALVQPDIGRFGIWGGLSERERRQIHKMRDKNKSTETIRTYIEDSRLQGEQKAKKIYKSGLSIPFTNVALSE